MRSTSGFRVLSLSWAGVASLEWPLPLDGVSMLAHVGHP